MKGCMPWNSVYVREDFASSGGRTRSARSVDQGLTRAPSRGWACRRKNTCTSRGKTLYRGKLGQVGHFLEKHLK